MTEAELRQAVAERDAKIRTLEAEAGEVKPKLATLEAQNARLVTERDAAMTERDAAANSLVEKEVAELVGKKISADEAESFVELAKKDRPLFTKMVAQRSDMKLLDAKLPIALDPLAKSVSGADDLSDLVAKAMA